MSNNSNKQTELNYFVGSSENESDEECDDWDINCKVVDVSYSGNRITGYDNMLSSSEKVVEPPRKQLKTSLDVNEDYMRESFIKKFQSSWKQGKDFKFNGSELLMDPFKVCILKDFINEGSLLKNMMDEFNDIEWHKRNMDLYEFFQSSDLKHLSTCKYISLFYNFLKDKVMNWISTLTGLELVDISATCSLYGDTDYLLIHDDQQDDRVIAFIIYLVDSDWKESYGGGLQLYSKDDKGHPFHAVREIFPSNNQFVFFQVADDSYHEVAEVTSKNYCRLSINGWFHSKIPPKFETPLYCAPSSGIFSKNTLLPEHLDVELLDWISEEYLDIENAKQIQAYIEENSEISLCNFIVDRAFNAILEDLNSDQVRWSAVGPPNRFCYSKLQESNLPIALERLLLLFKSESMFDLLRKYTDLELKSVKYEMQKWTPGNYMLLTDFDWMEKNELDLILYFNCPNSNSVVGGRTMYVTTEDEIQQALITVEPQENSLNIVYRDTARFTKYVSKQSKCQCFYMLICSYSE